MKIEKGRKKGLRFYNVGRRGGPVDGTPPECTYITGFIFNSRFSGNHLQSQPEINVSRAECLCLIALTSFSFHDLACKVSEVSPGTALPVTSHSEF